MKNLKISLVSILIAMTVTSCSLTLKTAKMSEKYQEAMSSNDKMKIIDPITGEKVKKSKKQVSETYKIYFKTSEIKNPYEVIAIYDPYILSIPIIAPAGKRYTKRLLPKSIEKCTKLGGNGIIVQSANCCFIIKEK